MDPSGGRDSRYNLNYSLGMMAGESPDSIYGNPNLSLARPPSGNLNLMGGGRPGGLQGTNNNSTNNNNNNNTSTSPGSLQCGLNRGMKRTNSDCYDDRVLTPGQTTLTGLETVNCGPGMGDGMDDGYTSLQPAHNNHAQHHNNNNNHSPVGSGGGGGGQQQQQQVASAQPNKKSPPSNGKKTKGRVKIKMEYIDNKLRRYTTFSKRKTGIMKKAYELSTLTGTQVMLLVASETGHVYTFATRKLQPMITSEAGKALIQTCLNSPDPPSGAATGDQRMSATGFEETELSYNIGDEDSKDGRSPMSSGAESDDSSGPDSPSVVMPIRTSSAAATQQQHQQQRVSIMEPNGLQGLVVEKLANGSSNNATATGGAISVRMGGKGNSAAAAAQAQSSNNGTAAINLAGLVGTLSRMDGLVGDLPSGLYPPSAFQHIRPEIVMQLVEMGHLKVHTTEDGQFIAVPDRKGSSSGGSGEVTTTTRDSSGASKSFGVGNGKAGLNSGSSSSRGGRNGRDGSPGTSTEMRIKKEGGGE